MLYVIRILIILKIGVFVIGICIKSFLEKLNYFIYFRNRILIIFRLKYLWKKKMKYFSNFKLFYIMKSVCKLLNLVICFISVFDL